MVFRYVIFRTLTVLSRKAGKMARWKPCTQIMSPSWNTSTTWSAKIQENINIISSINIGIEYHIEHHYSISVVNIVIEYNTLISHKHQWSWRWQGDLSCTQIMSPSWNTSTTWSAKTEKYPPISYRISISALTIIPGIVIDLISKKRKRTWTSYLYRIYWHWISYQVSLLITEYQVPGIVK